MYSSLDTSKELLLYKYRNGISLLSSDGMKYLRLKTREYTVADLLNLPFNVYFIDANGIHKNMNEANAQHFWMSSTHEAVGKTIYDIAERKSAEQVTARNQYVISSGNKSIVEDTIYKGNDHSFTTLTVRLPWYVNNNIVGIFGCSIILGKQSLGESFAKLSEMGLLSPNASSKRHLTLIHKDNGCIIPLYPQQIKCLKLLFDGNSDKAIAEKLKLSCRTVNHYLHHLRKKMGCRTSKEMIAAYSAQLLDQL